MTVKWETKDGISTRTYDSYEQYLEHQASKLNDYDMPWLAKYDRNYRSRLVEAMNLDGRPMAGKSVLCLAARIGTEVAAFIDLGCFAVGIDINPGSINQYVLYGDFHELQFADNSVDVIFCNSIDHVLYLDKFIAEAHRVLKPDGMLIIDIVTITDGEVGEWESMKWHKAVDLIDELQNKGPFQFTGWRVFIPEWNRKLVFLDRKGNEDEDGNSDIQQEQGDAVAGDVGVVL